MPLSKTGVPSLEGLLQLPGSGGIIASRFLVYRRTSLAWPNSLHTGARVYRFRPRETRYVRIYLRTALNWIYLCLCIRSYVHNDDAK